LCEFDGSEEEMLVGEGLAGDTGRRTVNDCPVVVDDLRNDGDFSREWAVVKEDNSADLNEALEI